MQGNHHQERRGLRGRLCLWFLLLISLVSLWWLREEGDPEEPFEAWPTLETPWMSTSRETLPAWVEEVVQSNVLVWEGLYPLCQGAFQGASGGYRSPGWVLFTGEARTGCAACAGVISPFYCAAAGRIYFDPASWRREFDNDEALNPEWSRVVQGCLMAWVMGFTVLDALGVGDAIHAQREWVSASDFAKLRLRASLAAMYLAGVWWRHAAEGLDLPGVVEGPGFERAIREVERRARRLVVTGAQGDRVEEGPIVMGKERLGRDAHWRWFRKGWESGDPVAHSAFDCRFEEL
jgi:predicted metalloprotease